MKYRLVVKNWYGRITNVIKIAEDRTELEQELEKIKGIGAAKARKIQCIAEIAKRVYRINNELPPVIKTPGDV